MRVLIVDDERNVVELIRYNLELNGFDADVAFDGAEAMSKLTNKKYDLVILDQMMPKMNGLEVIKRIRSTNSMKNIAVLMLTAKSDESDVIFGLNFGADDYITKPFRVHELIARVKALLRRVNQNSLQEATYVFEDFKIDAHKFEVIVADEVVKFTTKEFRLLLYLVENAGKVINRNTLLNEVWGYDYLGESRTVDVHIRNIRKKIEPDPKNSKYISTIVGEGYKFKKVE